MDGYQTRSDPDATIADLAQALLDRATQGLVGLDSSGHVVLCNRTAADMLDLQRRDGSQPMSREAFLGGCLGITDAGRAALAAALAHPPPFGSQSSSVGLTDGRALDVAVGVVGAGQRILTLERAAGLPVERTDGLTGLSDRQWFRERVAAMLSKPAGDPPEAERAAVLLIDLDRFKAVNDSHGHPVGDALLQLVAKRLRSAVRDGDVVSRLGGDEFAIAMPAVSGAEALGARIVDLLSRPYLVEGHIAIIGASVGIAIGPRDGADTDGLVRAADLALYQAKEDGRRTVRVFDAEMDSRARARHGLVDDLRRALVLQQFELHFQPQTNLASRGLVGFEALVRWRHPDHGLIPPDRFIPLAEELGLIVGIGEWVLRTACREAMSWPDHLTVAVNVSPKQLADREQLPRAVRAALGSTGLAATRLELEITESALIRHEKEALYVLHSVRAMGVRVSMDDFGTGYSSLSQLRSFPFDKLKIDRSFVNDLSGSDEAVAVVRAIAALGASLGMTTTAEGVETAEQEATIRADGCTDMQGYLVSRPVPAGDVAGLIERLNLATATSPEPTP